MVSVVGVVHPRADITEHVPSGRDVVVGVDVAVAPRPAAKLPRIETLLMVCPVPAV